MLESTAAIIKVRLLKADDFDALVQLDSKLRGGENRREYWEKKFAIFRLRHPNLSLVATLNEILVGYAMGNISGWEFGVSAGIGWVELIGTDPEYRRHHVASELIEELLHQFRTLKVESVYTLFTAANEEMRKFFFSMGFREGQLIHCEISL
ncbi:MAG: GNAT family N-acetyltransferase [bacterium]|nr:GNAT family N-acetyltransferase [bacterium]